MQQSSYPKFLGHVSDVLRNERVVFNRHKGVNGLIQHSHFGRAGRKRVVVVLAIPRGRSGQDWNTSCEGRWAHVSAPRRKFDILISSGREFQCVSGGLGGNGGYRTCEE